MDNWKDGIPLYCLIALIAMVMAYDAFEKHEARAVAQEAARPEHITVTTMKVDPRCVIMVDKP